LKGRRLFFAFTGTQELFTRMMLSGWNFFLISIHCPAHGRSLDIDLVQTSCGMAVPYYTYAGDRELLTDWAIRMGDDGLKQYWQEKNQASIDNILRSYALTGNVKLC
jgi:hypothetical protein